MIFLDEIPYSSLLRLKKETDSSWRILKITILIHMVSMKKSDINPYILRGEILYFCSPVSTWTAAVSSNVQVVKAGKEKLKERVGAMNL